MKIFNRVFFGLLLIISTFAITSCSESVIDAGNGENAQKLPEPKNDVESMGFTGKVKSLIYTYYDVEKMYVENKLTENNFRENEKGFIFDTLGYLIQDWETGKYAFNDTMHNIYALDSAHRVIEINGYKGLQPETRGSRKYNSAGQLLHETAYKDNVFTNGQIYKYDSYGNVCREEMYGRNTKGIDSAFVSYYIYRYDKMNNCIQKCLYYTSDSKVRDSTIYEYDKAGNKIKAIQYCRGDDDQLKTTYTTLYKYNHEGRLVQSILYMYGKEYEVHKYGYDEKGRTTMHGSNEDTHTSDGIVMCYHKYKYDSRGNYIYMREYIDTTQLPVRATAIAIEYYR